MEKKWARQVQEATSSEDVKSEDLQENIWSSDLSGLNKQLMMEAEAQKLVIKDLELTNSKLELKAHEMEKREAEMFLLKSELIIEAKEKDKHATSLVLISTELAIQKSEKRKRLAALFLAKSELSYHENQEAQEVIELKRARAELSHQKVEGKARAAELGLSSKALEHQISEKEKRTLELVEAGRTLAELHSSKSTVATELSQVNKAIATENRRRDKRAIELSAANTELIYEAREKDKLALELANINEQIYIKYQEKKTQADDLVLVTKELEAQQRRKETKAHELILNKTKTTFQSELERFRSEIERVKEDWAVFIETSNAPVIGVDADGNINMWNKKLAELTGYDQSEVLGKDLVQKYVSAGYRKTVKSVLDKTIEGADSESYELVFNKKNDEATSIVFNAMARRSANGKVIGMIGVGQDITELQSYRAELEEKVVERTRVLDAIFTMSPDGFVLVGSDKKIVYLNPAFLEMLGMKAQKLIGKSVEVFEEILESLLDVRHQLKTFTVSGNKNKQTIALSRPTARILDCNVRTIYTLTGEEDGQALYFRDVTSETEVDKMKSDFLSTAAHELRTPLASIYGFSELLLNRDYDQKVSQEMVQTIHRQSIRLKQLLNELLDLSRIESRAGKDFYMVTSTLETVVKESCAEAQGAFEGREIEDKTSGDWPKVSCDIEKMQQVFINLLSNGFKYSPEATKVILKTVQRVKGEQEQFGVYLKDSGIGMSSQQLAHLGERFYRAEDSGSIRGTGLGVSLVKEIVEIHGGEIDFVSSKGKGMEVTVWLPIVS